MSDGTLAAGQVVRGYRVERWLARGAMGEVYEATQIALDRRIALKVIAREYGTDPSFQERFRREAKTAASIEHANILPVYESGELEDGRLFLAMRFVEGQDLESYLQAHGPMEPGAAIALLSQIAAAIDVAHAKGLVHRDIKPANVMLENRDRRLHSFLTDFGLAKAQMNTGLTAAGAILGTPNYMAPEQFESPNVDGRADVYSFGCLVYRCLTGETACRPSGTRTSTTRSPCRAPSARRYRRRSTSSSCGRWPRSLRSARTRPASSCSGRGSRSAASPPRRHPPSTRRAWRPARRRPSRPRRRPRRHPSAAAATRYLPERHC